MSVLNHREIGKLGNGAVEAQKHSNFEELLIILFNNYVFTNVLRHYNSWALLNKYYVYTLYDVSWWSLKYSMEGFWVLLAYKLANILLLL